MNTPSEGIIRQAVLDTINQVGCNGHISWNLENSHEVEVFTNRVMYHIKAIEYKLAQDKIRREAIMVDLDILEDSYKDGFKTGANWKDTYIPGGPWYFGADKHESDRNKGIAMQLQAEHFAWMQGFYDGNGIPLDARNANVTLVK